MGRLKVIGALVGAFMLGAGALWGAQAAYEASVGKAYETGLMEGVNRVMATIGQELMKSGSVTITLRQGEQQRQMKLVEEKGK